MRTEQVVWKRYLFHDVGWRSSIGGHRSELGLILDKCAGADANFGESEQYHRWSALVHSRNMMNSQKPRTKIPIELCYVKLWFKISKNSIHCLFRITSWIIWTEFKSLKFIALLFLDGMMNWQDWKCLRIVHWTTFNNRKKNRCGEVGNSVIYGGKSSTHLTL